MGSNDSEQWKHNPSVAKRQLCLIKLPLPWRVRWPEKFSAAIMWRHLPAQITVSRHKMAVSTPHHHTYSATETITFQPIKLKTATFVVYGH